MNDTKRNLTIIAIIFFAAAALATPNHSAPGILAMLAIATGIAIAMFAARESINAWHASRPARLATIFLLMTASTAAASAGGWFGAAFLASCAGSFVGSTFLVSR